MIRICYISRPGLGVITGTQNIGGGQIQSLREATELAKDKRFDVHMLVEGKCATTFAYNRITVHVIPKKRILADVMQTYKALKEINADIYFSRMLTRFQIFYEPLICKLLGKKYIYSEIIDPLFVLERPFKLIGLLMYKKGLRAADAIIANSTDIRKKLARFTKRTMHIVPVPICLSVCSATQRKHIIWVGRPIRLKRPELFLELAKRFPKEKFMMLIAGEYAAQLPPNVTVKYNVNNKYIDQYYAASKMLVQTSRSEGFGNVYLEAWRNKTPVASMLNPDGVLTKYNTGLYSESFEELVKNVKLLLTNKKKWREFSENSYRYVKKNHDINKIIEQYKELFLKSL